MQRAMPMHEPSSAGRGSSESSTQLTKSAGTKRERDVRDVTVDIATRREILKASARSLPVAQERPLVATEQTRSRDRDLGVHRVDANDAASRRAPARVRVAHALAHATDQQMEAALARLSTWRHAPPRAARDALMQRSTQRTECAVISGRADVCTSQRKPPQAVVTYTSRCEPPHVHVTMRAAAQQCDRVTQRARAQGMRHISQRTAAGWEEGGSDRVNLLIRCPQSAVAGPS
jgi:hypothetical protein